MLWGTVVLMCRVAPYDIDIVITACSVYCPTPSLSSLLVSQLGLREDIISCSLGGMGCSSGVTAILLARELLQVCGLVLHALATAGQLPCHDSLSFSNQAAITQQHCMPHLNLIRSIVTMAVCGQPALADSGCSHCVTGARLCQHNLYLVEP